MVDHVDVVTAKAEDVVVKRVRKLLRLAESPNEHEAARAREEAQRLMQRHGLSAGDVEENAIEAVEGKLDAFRREILITLAEAHGCSVVAGSAGHAFKGAASKARAAATAYRSLIQAGESCELDVRIKGSPEPVVVAWRACLWLGLASRLTLAAIDLKARRNVRPPKPAPDIDESNVDWGEAREIRREPGVVTEAKSAVFRTGGIVDTNWLAREAHAAGERAFQIAGLDDELRAREGVGQQKQIGD